MDNVIKSILKEYQINRNQAIQAAETRKRDLLIANPRLAEIENELAHLSIQTTQAILQQQNASEQKKLLENLKKQSNDLIKEKNKFIKELVKDSSYLKPRFSCKHCKDTGYVEKDGNSVLCSCLKQKIFDAYYNKSNVGNLKKENFSKFNSNIFSSQRNPEVYKSKLSPKENMEIIKEKAENFIQNFDDPNEKNLLFTGNTGLGKTFLTNCIANEFLLQRKTVLYQTAPVMFDELIDAKFHKENSNFDLPTNILTADLLIIDDLGTERTSDLYITELFTILNTRLLNQNNKITKTIISTNLKPEEIQQIYTTRISSRIVGYYRILRFFGEDLRFKKGKTT